MSANQKRLERIEQALAQLLQRDQAFILWHPKAESQEEALELAAIAGVFNPDTQDAIIILSHIPRKGYQMLKQTDLPAPDRRLKEMHELAESANKAPRFEGSYPSEPAAGEATGNASAFGVLTQG